MPRYVAHFDETDHMDGRLLGFGGSFTTGGRLPGLAERWESMREDLDMEGREIRWNNLGWNKRVRLAEWVSLMQVSIVADLLLDQRGMTDRTARDHYRIALRWAVGMVARVAAGGPHTGQHQIVVDRVPGIRNVTGEQRDDPRLAWTTGRGQTYAHAEYDTLYREGNRAMRVPVLRDESFYPSLLESDATYNCFLEMADMAIGTIARWAAATFEGKPDARLDEMVQLMAPRLALPNGELGLDILCPNWERSPYWGARSELLQTARRWARV